MIQSARHTFKVRKATTFRKLLTVYEGDSDSSPTRDFTGYTARMPIKSQTTSDILETLTTENGGITLGSSGDISLFLSDEATDEATWERGFYTLYITTPGGDTEALLYGTFTIDKSY